MEFGELILQTGRTKKLSLYKNGLIFKKSGKTTRILWKDIKKVTYFWEKQEWVGFTGAQSIQLMFFIQHDEKGNERDTINVELTYPAMFYGIDAAIQTKRIKKLINTISSTGCLYNSLILGNINN